MFCRFLAFFFTVATIVLSFWALVGSYKNANYLTDNFLLSFQTSNLNVSALLKEAVNAKRDVFFPQEDASSMSHLAATPTFSLAENTSDIVRRALDLNPTAILASTLSNVQRTNDIVAGVTAAYSVPTDEISALLQTVEPTRVASEVQAIASSLSLPPTLASIAADIIENHSTTNDLLQKIARSVNAFQLGLADIYSISFWGYCKGSINGTIEQNPVIDKYPQLLNKDVTWLNCTPPKVGFTFDPLTILKEELLSAINASALLDTNGPLSSVMSTLSSQLLAVVDLLTYDTIGLPGELESYLPYLSKWKDVGFACILAGACLAIISLMFQLTGMCCSPNFSCLSCLNFMFMALTFIIVILGSALTTGVIIFVRKILNQQIEQYGIESFLSVQFYAFSWSAVAAALCCLVLSIIGYCCGCFKSDRITRISRLRRNAPELKYYHKM